MMMDDGNKHPFFSQITPITYHLPPVARRVFPSSIWLLECVFEFGRLRVRQSCLRACLLPIMCSLGPFHLFRSYLRDCTYDIQYFPCAMKQPPISYSKYRYRTYFPCYRYACKVSLPNCKKPSAPATLPDTTQTFPQTSLFTVHRLGGWLACLLVHSVGLFWDCGLLCYPPTP